MNMNSLINVLKKNVVFKFVSSVRLAVPLMLAIAAVVAAGTLYESRYNADVARILVYRTWWFEGLMTLLWLNIFCAAVSRYPYKVHHTGFLITHAGLLTLLFGAQVTASWGIDGQLRVPEGQSSNTVFLSNLVLKVAGAQGTPAWSYPVDRTLSPKTGDELGISRAREQTGVIVDNYLPFVAAQQTMVRGNASESKGVALTFTLQSAFFKVDESLNTSDKPEMQLGPARLRIVTDSASPDRHASIAPSESRRQLAGATSSPVLIVKESASGKALGRIPLAELQRAPKTVNGVRISLVHAFAHAMVASGKLAEGDASSTNPALELKVESGGKAVREIAFAKFPTFALNKEGALGLAFTYQSGTADDTAAATENPHSDQAESNPHADGIPMHGPNGPDPAEGMPPAMGSGRNVIEFHVSPSEEHSLRVVLLKDGASVLSKSVKVGETLTTPWMGMKITVNSVVPNGVMAQEIRPTEMQPKLPLPPSAVFIRSDLPGSEGAWLMEGDARTIQTSHGTFEVYYGMDSVQLPFGVKLDQFRKVDYPGTETAMSFESTIRLNEGGIPTRIQMNEPFLHEGYMLYQSSYEMGPGIPTASIFSVNRDPGRWIKYLGAIILVIGIAVFTIMRSRWYNNRKGGRPLKKLATTTALIFLALGAMNIGVLGFNPLLRSAHADDQPQHTFQDFSPDAARESFRALASRIDTSIIEELPVQSHGRVKPFDSFAREEVLFISGKYSMWGLNSIQLYLGLMLSDSTPYLELINIRDPDLRVNLGFPKTQRFFSLQQLSNSPLEKIARPLVAKQEQNEKLVTPDEKKVLEAFQQVWLLRNTLTGAMLSQAMILDTTAGNSGTHAASAGLVTEKAQAYFGALRSSDFSGAAMPALELVSAAKGQSMPELFRPEIGKLRLEVSYNHWRLFFWAGILYVLLGCALFSGLLTKTLTRKVVFSVLALPLVLHAAGFAIRVYITGFSPVTSMYGTMVWMAFGVVLFGSILFGLYRNAFVYGLLLSGAGCVLLLTESIPLILNPDMDPIVAVLRNNFWLTIHVLTISISYAAFTIAMLIGNTALVQTTLRKDSREGLNNLAHLAYRAIQLGVFLLTAGIILGGWWADYSWGRFWGWDPKETWALIADLGFISILHAKFVGWVKPFGLLAAAPIAYLLVIMAWYGVNFILAAGLHSYGFSSGGATIVVIFVCIQLLLFGAGMLSKKFRVNAAAHGSLT